MILVVNVKSPVGKELKHSIWTVHLAFHLKWKLHIIYLLYCSHSSTTSNNGNQPHNIKTEPKFIVFLSQLLLLFQICPSCKGDGISVEWKTLGTMVQVTTLCSNQTCTNKTVWRSQPQMPGTDIPAGNFLTSFATLVSGSLAVKVFNVLQHIGLCCISLRTYYRHQSVSTAIYCFCFSFSFKDLNLMCLT